MGIQGLLPFLKPIHRQASLSKFKGESAAVDGFCWLHKSAYSCAQDLALEIPTNSYITGFMKKIKLLLDFNIKPIVVFDGNRLPAKKSTDDERKRSRLENLKLGKDYYAKGNKSKAYECFLKSISITFEMVTNVMKECQKLGVSCLIAPYEADAQLVCLQRLGFVSLIISEDSDLLVFGCSKVLYKMDADGKGVLIDGNDLCKVASCKELFQQKGHWSFRQMCILSGCDYLDSIRGIGLMTACKLMLSHNNAYEAIDSLRSTKGVDSVPLDYNNQFRMAENVFIHQIVFNPLTKTNQYLSDVCGSNVPNIASCQLHSSTNSFDWSEFETNWVGCLSAKIDCLQHALGNINSSNGQSSCIFTVNDFRDLYNFTPSLVVVSSIDNKENVTNNHIKTNNDLGNISASNLKTSRITLNKIKNTSSKRKLSPDTNKSTTQQDTCKSSKRKIYQDPFKMNFSEINESSLASSKYFKEKNTENIENVDPTQNIDSTTNIHPAIDTSKKRSKSSTNQLLHLSPSITPYHRSTNKISKSSSNIRMPVTHTPPINNNSIEYTEISTINQQYIDEDILSYAKQLVVDNKKTVREEEIQSVEMNFESFSHYPKRVQSSRRLLNK